MNIGDKVKDIITGFSGVITGRTEYITGCERMLVQPDVPKDDGTVIGAQWLDVGRLEVLSTGVHPARLTEAKQVDLDVPAPVK